MVRDFFVLCLVDLSRRPWSLCSERIVGEYKQREVRALRREEDPLAGVPNQAAGANKKTTQQGGFFLLVSCLPVVFYIDIFAFYQYFK